MLSTFIFTRVGSQYCVEIASFGDSRFFLCFQYRRKRGALSRIELNRNVTKQEQKTGGEKRRFVYYHDVKACCSIERRLSKKQEWVRMVGRQSFEWCVEPLVSRNFVRQLRRRVGGLNFRATVKPVAESCLPKDNWKRATNFFNAVPVVPV